MNLLQYLTKNTVGIPLQSNDKEGVIREMAGLLANSGCVLDEAALVRSMRQREGVATTSVGEGVAIPHGKCEETDGLCVALGIVPKGVEWPAVDGEPVRIVLAIAGPPASASDQLRLLSQATRVLKEKAFRDALLLSKTEEEVLSVFHSALRKQETARTAAATSERQLLIVVLKQDYYLEFILQYLVEMGVEAGIYLEGSSLQEAIATNVPLFADFLIGDREPEQNRLIIGFASPLAVTRLTEGLRDLVEADNLDEHVQLYALDVTPLRVSQAPRPRDKD